MRNTIVLEYRAICDARSIENEGICCHQTRETVPVRLSAPLGRRRSTCLRCRVSSMRWFGRREQDLNEEIQSHIRMATQDRVDAGQDPRRARSEVMREFGGVARHMEDTRDVWGWRWADQTLF